MKNTSVSNKNVSPRALAHATLLKVESGQYANISIDTALSRNTLSAEDRALFTSLVYGVLERKVTLDFIISQYSSRQVEEIQPPVAYALRMGLYQLIYLDRVPDFAASNESVELVDRLADTLDSDGKTSLLVLAICILSVDETISREEVTLIKKLLQ